MDTAEGKLEKLREYLAGLGSVAVAFSGGVDSTFLLKIAHETLGARAVAVTAKSCVIPAWEADEAEVFCKSEGITQYIYAADVLAVEGFADNPPERCYLCKKSLFEGMGKIVREHGIMYLAEGSNMDDMGDYRPGMRAIEELGVKSPLRHAELYKHEIRELSKKYGLPTWDKPSYACLASRFAYGEHITEEKLKMVGRAERLLMDMGFAQMRVRLHGTLARIEVPVPDFDKILRDETRAEIAAKFKEYGFAYVSLDLQGFRSGSMNEALTDERRV